MKRTLLIISVVALGAVAIWGWTLAWKYKAAADKSESILLAQERLRLSTAQYTPATFVRIDGSTMFYRIPHEVTMDGSTYINQIETSATLNPNAVIIGIPGNDGIGALLQLQEGRDIRISVDVSDDAKPQINAVYVLP